MKRKSNDLVAQNKVFAYLGIGTGIILSIPLVMTQVSSEWDWGLFDFAVIGILIFGAGSLFVYVARRVPRKYRLLLGILFLVALLAAYVHLAVGIVDTWPLAGS